MVGWSANIISDRIYVSTTTPRKESSFVAACTHTSYTMSTDQQQRPNLEWFKHYWYVFHMAAIMAPAEPSDEDREYYRVFYNVFGHSIPCETECQPDYFRIIHSVFPFRYGNADELWMWSVDVHNEVNRKLGKRPVSYDFARQMILDPPQQKQPSASGAQQYAEKDNNDSSSQASSSDATSSTTNKKKPSIQRWLFAAVGFIVVAVIVALIARRQYQLHKSGSAIRT